MNVFYTLDSLYLDHPISPTLESLTSFPLFCAQLRKTLGESDYELDDYVDQFLTVAYNLSEFNAADDARQTFSAIVDLCSNISSNSLQSCESPYYEIIKEIADRRQKRISNPRMLSVLILYDAIPLIAEDIIHNYVEMLESRCAKLIDIVEIRHSHRALCNIVGVYKMERLNMLIKNLFYAVPIGDMFIQAFFSEYLSYLQTYDKKSKKKVYELMIDEVQIKLS